jgi:sugar-specific transcriptional regulator TrmB
MKKRIEQALERLGHSHKEIQIYLTLLQMGEGTVSEIARQTKLPRSTTQLVVTELQKKGLISLGFKREHQVWVAENPTRFLTALHDKEVMVRKLLPELQQIRRQSKKKPLLKYFNGKSTVRHILDEIVLSKQHIYAFGCVSYLAEYLGEFTVEEFFQTIFERPIPTELLSCGSDFLTQLKGKNQFSRSGIKTYNDERLEQVFYFLFDNKVALLLLNHQETIAITIDDETLFASWLLFFKMLWEKGTS